MGWQKEPRTSSRLPGPESPEAVAGAEVPEQQAAAREAGLEDPHSLPSPSLRPPLRGRRPVPLDDWGHQLRQLLHLEGGVGRRQQRPHRHLPARGRICPCRRSPRRRGRCRRLFAAARRHLPSYYCGSLRGLATGSGPPPRRGGSDVIGASNCATQSPAKTRRRALGSQSGAGRGALRGSCACAGRSTLSEGGGGLASALARWELFPKLGAMWFPALPWKSELDAWFQVAKPG